MEELIGFKLSKFPLSLRSIVTLEYFDGPCYRFLRMNTAIAIFILGAMSIICTIAGWFSELHN